MEQHWQPPSAVRTTGPARQDRRTPIAWEGAALYSKSIAALLDYCKTGVLPDFDAGSSPESQLEAGRAHRAAAGHPMSWHITAPCLTKEERKVIAQTDEVTRWRKKNKAAGRARRSNQRRK